MIGTIDIFSPYYRVEYSLDSLSYYYKNGIIAFEQKDYITAERYFSKSIGLLNAEDARNNIFDLNQDIFNQLQDDIVNYFMEVPKLNKTKFFGDYSAFSFGLRINLKPTDLEY